VKKRLLSRAQSLIRVKKAERKIAKAFEQGQVEISFGPSSLNLMMMDSCNLQCIMCGKDYQSCGTQDYLSLQDIKVIYSHLDMSQVVDVIYGGGGEPFLNPDLGSIAAFTQRNYPIIQHTVISNFIQWKEEAVSSMLDNNVNFLISVNAATPETYQKIAGVDAYSAVIKHVEKLVRMREEKGVSVHIALSMILMRQNIEELEDFVKLAKDLGVDEVKTLYTRIYPEEYRSKKNRPSPIVSTDSLFYAQQQSDARIKEAEKISKQLGIRFDHEPLFSCLKSGDRDCHEPWKSLFINFNGDVYPCPASEILFKPRVDSGEYKSGNILKQPISEFWNNTFWRTLRETNRQTDRKEQFPECLCCGNSISWLGTQVEKAHILDWTELHQNDKKTIVKFND